LATPFDVLAIIALSQEYLSTVSQKDVQASIASLEARNGPVDPAGAVDASTYGQNECVIVGFGRWLSEPPLRSPASAPYRVFTLLLRLLRAYMYIWSQSNIIERTIFMIASGVVRGSIPAHWAAGLGVSSSYLHTGEHTPPCETAVKRRNGSVGSKGSVVESLRTAGSSHHHTSTTRVCRVRRPDSLAT